MKAIILGLALAVVALALPSPKIEVKPTVAVFGRTLWPTPPPTAVHYRYQPANNWPY